MSQAPALRWTVARALIAAAVTGILTYAYLAIASRSLDPAQFDQFSVFWSIALVLGFGLFLPVEQELARVGGSGATDATGRAAMRVAAEIALIVAIVLLVPIVLWSSWLRVAPALIVCCALVGLVSSVQYVGRGLMHTQGRVRRFADVLVFDSGLRVVGALVVVLVGLLTALHPEALAFALVLPAAILVAHAWLLRPLWSETAASRARVRTFRVAVVSLLGASIAAQLLANTGPVLIQALSGHAGEAGAFQATYNLARVPLLIVTPLQGVLVAPLAAMVARGDSHRLARVMIRVCALVAGLALVGAVLGWWLGPWIITLIFGPGRALPAADVAILVAGVCFYVGVVICTQAFVALKRHRTATWLWVVALAVAACLFAALVVPLGPVRSFEIGFGVGSLVGLVVALVALRATQRLASRQSLRSDGASSM